TDCLRFLFCACLSRTDVVDRLAALLETTGERRIVDFASGSSGVIGPLVEELTRRRIDVRATLSDLYPQVARWNRLSAEQPRIDFLTEPVDARSPPSEPAGVRTMFSAFHHLRPACARAVLTDAARCGRPIAVFEVSERSVATLATLLFMPLAVWLSTPFLRPFSLRRLVFTYLVPVVPALVTWDGIASCFRTYSCRELRALASELPAAGYRVDIGRRRVRGLPVAVLWLMAWPEPSGSAVAPPAAAALQRLETSEI
ncbi:MAG: hypothetical protein AAGN46_11475, partial [Acidobacteriota bacterium]